MFGGKEAVAASMTAALPTPQGTIIDAAVSFINSAIEAFGELAKGLIQGLLGQLFPELAEALCGFVDSAVTMATEAVTALGEKRKEGITALGDALEGAINAILSVYAARI